MLCILGLCFIDFYMITPLLPMPQDICYYHSHEPSFFIKHFYLDSSGHIEPPFSAIYMLFLFVLGCWLGYVVNLKWKKFLKK